MIFFIFLILVVKPIEENVSKKKNCIKISICKYASDKSKLKIFCKIIVNKNINMNPKINFGILYHKSITETLFLFLVFQIIDKKNIHKISKKSINTFERVEVYNTHPFDENRFDARTPAVSDVQSVFTEELTQDPAANGYSFNNKYPMNGNISNSMEDIIKIIEDKIPIIIGVVLNNSEDTIIEDNEVPVEPDATTADSSLFSFNFFDIKYEMIQAENTYNNENKNILSIKFDAKPKFFTRSIPNDTPNNIIPIFT